MARKKGIPGVSFSWKRAVGISAAKGKISRSVGVPLTKKGRQRKVGDMAGCCLPILLALTLFLLGLALAGCGGKDTDDPMVYISGTTPYYYSQGDPNMPPGAKAYRRSVVMAQGYVAAPQGVAPGSFPVPSPVPVPVPSASVHQYPGVAQPAVQGASSAAAAFPRDNAEMVYITKSGKKYHRAGCEHLKKSKQAILKDEAIKRGYMPCSRCNP